MDITLYKEYFEAALNEKLMYLSGAEEPIASAVRYALLGSGKRLRPILAMLTAEFMGGDKSDVIDLAIGIECIHNYSLVHDDLPCMDNDDIRHGKPSTHKKFGEGIGVLAGDALLNLAFEFMLSHNYSENHVKGVAKVAKYAGIFGMIGGQCIDILPIENRDKTLDEVIKLNMLKTSCLFKASVIGSAVSLGADEAIASDLEIFCENLGLIFQIVDDILDIESTTEVLGKPINSDREKKLTFLDIVGLNEAKKIIILYEKRAIDAINKYGDKASNLIELCRHLTARKK